AISARKYQPTSSIPTAGARQAPAHGTGRTACRVATGGTRRFRTPIPAADARHVPARGTGRTACRTAAAVSSRGLRARTPGCALVKGRRVPAPWPGPARDPARRPRIGTVRPSDFWAYARSEVPRPCDAGRKVGRQPSGREQPAVAAPEGRRDSAVRDRPRLSDRPVQGGPGVLL